MLRHAYGYKLANDGIDTRSLQAHLGGARIVLIARDKARGDATLARLHDSALVSPTPYILPISYV